MTEPVEFVVAIGLDARSAYICGSPDSMPAYSPDAKLFIYDEVSEHRWNKHDAPWWCVSLTVFVESDDADWELCALSNEGHVEFVGFDHDPVEEEILGAGVHSADARNWGYMSALRQIGNHLYACGGAGQVYRRIGPNHWAHMDVGLLQSPNVAERLLPRAIDGPHERTIYLVGALSSTGLPPRVRHWNGQSWRQLELPAVAERITNIHVESEARIWLCGANGTLLLGNAHDGFRSLSTTEDNQLFYSLCLYEGVIFLGSNLGLYAYDPAESDKGIRRVITGLTPELEDANIVVDAVDGVLWSIGEKDIVRYDGEKWERIDHPDNPPIR